MRRSVGSVFLAIGLLSLTACDFGGSTPAVPTPIPARPPATATVVALAPTPPAAPATATGTTPPSTLTAANVPTLAATPPEAPATPPAVSPTAPGSPPAATAPRPPRAPAGAYLIYARPDGGLWRVDGAGHAPIQLAPASEPDVLLPWAASPDGGAVAYVSGSGVWDNSTPGTTPALALWIVQADGSGRHKIQNLLPSNPIDTTPGGADQDLLQALTTMQELAWSPDGSRVAFVSAHEDEVDLYTATPDGKIVRLTQTDSLKKSPRWSPDGRLVACMTTGGFGTGAGWDNAGVILAPAAGGAAAQDYPNLKLTGGQPATFLADLLWLGPDMLVAAVEAVVPGGVEITGLAPSSGAWTRILTVAGGAEAGFWWSAPDATLAIAVTPSNGDGTPAPANAGLYTWKPGAARAAQVTGATVGPIALSPQQTLDPVGPVAWRPQGGLLAYNIQENSAQIGVHLWPASGNAGGRALTSGSVDDVVWSPDGQRLAANGDIYRPDGGKVASLPGANALLGWAPQGIFFTTPEGANGGADTSKLLIWQAGAAQQLDAGLAGSVWGKVVVPQP